MRILFFLKENWSNWPKIKSKATQKFSSFGQKQKCVRTFLSRALQFFNSSLSPISMLVSLILWQVPVPFQIKVNIHLQNNQYFCYFISYFTMKQWKQIDMHFSFLLNMKSIPPLSHNSLPTTLKNNSHVLYRFVMCMHKAILWDGNHKEFLEKDSATFA